jgi:hypothetical protein
MIARLNRRANDARVTNLPVIVGYATNPHVPEANFEDEAEADFRFSSWRLQPHGQGWFLTNDARRIEMPTPGAFDIGSLKYNSPGDFDHARGLGVRCVGHGGHMHNLLADLLGPRRLQSRDRSWPVASCGSGVRRFVLTQGDLFSGRPAISASPWVRWGPAYETTC